MRTLLATAALLAATAFTPVDAAASEGPVCAPNPLNQSHPAWVRVPTTAVDLGAPAPASAINPLMQGAGPSGPAGVPQAGAGVIPVNPLTNRP